MDIKPTLSPSRLLWFKNNISNAADITYICQKAGDYVNSMIGSGRHGWPTVRAVVPELEQIKAGYVSENTARSLQIADRVVTRLVHEDILQPNKWNVADISSLRRSRK